LELNGKAPVTSAERSFSPEETQKSLLETACSFK
jgi:hypothetical protein